MLDFLVKQDFVGAATLLDLDRKFCSRDDINTKLWLAYAYFHNGDYSYLHYFVNLIIENQKEFTTSWWKTQLTTRTFMLIKHAANLEIVITKKHEPNVKRLQNLI